MEEDELPDLEIGDYSAEYNWRTSKRNVGHESPTPIARDILQGDNIHDFERTTEDEQLPNLTKGDPLEDDEIRILVLYPSDDYNAPLQGRRERQRLIPDGSLSTNHDHQAYEAVSYIWGTNVYEGFISIDGVEIPIPLNLKLALLRIRKVKHERRIWADAVCINMADLVERRHQLSKIRYIFESAASVLVWLGEEPNRFQGTLPLMRQVAREPARWVDRFHDHEWHALQVLLIHPYFTRIWVVQEIAVARHITVLHGVHLLDWKTFLKATRVVCIRFTQQKTQLSPYVDSQVDRAISFVLNLGECFRFDKGIGTRLHMFSLEELVFKFSTAEASDLRDNIYGLLEIAADANAWKSKERFPDYSISWEEVQRRFYVGCIKSSGSLDVIFRQWKWPQSSPWLFHQANNRDRTVSLVQAPGHTSPYNLFDGCGLDLKLRGLTVLDSDRIFTKGYLFDEVDIITDIHDNSDVPFPSSWLSKDLITDAPKFARTLLADAEGVYFDEALDLVRCISRMAKDDEYEEDRSSQLSRLLKAFEDLCALTKGRRLFRSKRWSVKGFGPSWMKAGDLICFTPQCSVPIVLRAVENEDWRYKIIGTCYVCGYMSGQISNLLLEDQLPVIDIMVPFGVDAYASKAVSTAAQIVDNDPTEELLDLARDSRTHISKDFTNTHMVRETCEFQGLGHYMEYRPGAIKELAKELQNGGYTVTLEPWNPVDIWNNFFDTAIPRLQMIAENFCKQYVVATLCPTSREVLNMKAADSISNTYVSVSGGSSKTPALVPNTSTSGNPRASASTSSAQSRGTSNQRTSPLGTSVPRQAIPVASSPVAAVISTNPSNVTIPSSGDFIHICFKVKRYPKLRHDLILTQVTKDRELFTKLREAYAANFSWAHRNLSIWTVQKINFVKFNQWERNEVANLQHGVPPDSERHYTSKPNPRGYEPVLDNDFLMHRFTCSPRARCLDASIGFEHIPKRIGRPEPWDHNEHPDLGIGWGLQLEEGCFRRLCIIVVGGFVVSAVTGIVWSALARDVQSGFAVASWLLASGAILVATVQLLVTLPAI